MKSSILCIYLSTRPTQIHTFYFSPGTILCGLLKEYVTAINDPDAIPCLDNAWQNTVDLLKAKTMEELIKKYKTTMTV